MSRNDPGEVKPRKTQLPCGIIKRDGSRVAFEPRRIVAALARAGLASGEFDDDEADFLGQRVLKVLRHRFSASDPTVEQVQDIVEQVLVEANHLHTFRAYVTYRDQHRRLRDTRKTLIDVETSINEYVDRADWRVKANANQGYSLGGLILNVSGKVIANYWLSHVYPPEIGQAHREADFHIHDLDMLSGYCAGWSLRSLLFEGFNGVAGKPEADPPKHFSSALGQMVNFLGTLQNEWAGAQAFSSFDTYLAPYVRNDELDYGAVRQGMQEFIYNLNVPSRWGTQTPFTNLTFDWVCPADLREQVPVVGGKEMDFTYGDLQAEMDLINRAFIEVMSAGDRRGRVYLPHPDLQHHAGLPVGIGKRRTAVRHDRQVRAAVLPEFSQFRHAAEPCAFDVLPPAARPSRAAQARQRSVRLGRADRLDRRRDDQLRAAGLPFLR
jgi:ribonucleoside-triphosphate reductase